MAHGATPATETLAKEEEIATFVANPIMSAPHQVIMDHITYLLALVMGGAPQEAAVALLMPAHILDFF
jgi:hypothetical protein